MRGIGTRRGASGLRVVALAAALLLGGCGGEEEAELPPAATDLPAAAPGLDADREIFVRTMEWSRQERLDTLPLGEVLVRLGRRFVGTTYTPNTLDLPGDERLVVNLRELDCVTYLENMLAMALLVRGGGGSFEDFQEALVGIRYREGEIEGFPSRLHYFSEWIAENEEKGLVRNVTRELGGVVDDEPIFFMTAHRESYRQLEDPEVFEAIRRIERELSTRPRYFIPESRIAEAAPGIRNGDIIAATSTLAGLDAVHTGMAIWIDGRLHLMHAPLVGKTVEISELPLAQRIQRIESQDGIMVARPQ